MKIFLIGDWHSELHEEIIKKSFIKFDIRLVVSNGLSILKQKIIKVIFLNF